MMNDKSSPSDGAGLPVIGITAHNCRVQWATWESDVNLVPQLLVDRVVAAGGVPVLLPPDPGIAKSVGRLDGLLLPGGVDVDPATYGAERHAETEPSNSRRDTAEFAVLAAALDRELPVFGICRGMQVLNIALGGTLHQHIPDFLRHDRHAPGAAAFGDQPVRLEPDSLLAKAMGQEIPPVPCHHRQALDQLGTGLTATAWSQDGIVEAVELAGYPFAVAVQWHAERDGYDELFGALVEAARR